MDALIERRIEASVASLGSSSDAIHTALLKLVAALPGAAQDVLDFGAGRGLLTGSLAGLSGVRSVTGYDLMQRPEQLPERIRWRSFDLNDDFSASGDRFDLIVASEVIEHLENPRATARGWFRLLKAGGVLVMSTPNNESLRSLLALLTRGHFVDFGNGSYPAHITALLRKDIERILQEAGFTPPAFSYTQNGVVPKLTSLTWQKLSFGLLQGRLFSDNLIAVAKKL